MRDYLIATIIVCALILGGVVFSWLAAAAGERETASWRTVLWSLLAILAVGALGALMMAGMMLGYSDKPPAFDVTVAVLFALTLARLFWFLVIGVVRLWRVRSKPSGRQPQ